jgi:tetratricopeptide (TPR) repeat protein
LHSVLHLENNVLQSSILNANLPSRLVRLLLIALAVALALGVIFSPLQAVADEYTDVSQLMRSGKTTEALAKIEQQLITRPRDPQMRFFKGLIQRDTGKPTEAIATFTALTEEYPELPEPYNNLAVLYAAQNQFERARAALEMALKNNPRYAVAYENLGDVYARLAAEAYDKALQIDATSSASLMPKLKVVKELFSLTSK